MYAADRYIYTCESYYVVIAMHANNLHCELVCNMKCLWNTMAPCGGKLMAYDTEIQMKFNLPYTEAV
jgi:hypothetical protein